MRQWCPCLRIVITLNRARSRSWAKMPMEQRATRFADPEDGIWKGSRIKIIMLLDNGCEEYVGTGTSEKAIGHDVYVYRHVFGLVESEFLCLISLSRTITSNGTSDF